MKPNKEQLKKDKEAALNLTATKTGRTPVGGTMKQTDSNMKKVGIEKL